jgi:hippurate hydrolase
MPVINRVAETAPEIAAWRRELHQNPELQYEVHGTAAFVAERLRAFGCDEVVTGIGRTGVVGVIRGGKGGPGKTGGDQVIGLRADMDALPILEDTGLAYASKTPGRMHACGHDGHSAMLLGAARHLCETRNFSGTAIVIFQPAEEGGAGAKAMIDDGLLDRFGIQRVFGMHNRPGLPVGEFSLRSGPLMAASDTLAIEVEGRGGHAAHPHRAIDTILVASQIVVALQSIVSRNVDPVQSAVVSITVFQGGQTDNVIPQTVRLGGTARSLTPDMRDLLEERITALVPAIAGAFGARATVTYSRNYPVTRNDPAETAFAAEIAAGIAGTAAVHPSIPPVMGGEDFAFMLEKRPGAMIFVGNGQSASLHHPKYDFDDAAIPFGVSYWVRLVETAMAA